MKLSRKWLNEFVDIGPVSDRDFAEAMTLSGSKVEVTEVLNESLKNVVAGRIVKMEKHPDSDHMWVCQLDVGEAEPTQIVTGAWNIHEGDLVPVAKHNSLLPGGVKITKGKLRGVLSNGMLCSLKELNLTAEHDYPYAVIKAAALLNDYHPLDKDKPSIPADVQPGHKIYGKVVAARVTAVSSEDGALWACALDTGSGMAAASTDCANIHEGDMVAYDTGKNHICTLADLHADQKEFPHCIADGIFVLHEDGVKPGDDMAAVIGADDHVVEFEITPNRPDCLSVIGLAREGEAIQTLDGNERKLTPNMLCICDEHKPVCVAGVMGGANSEIIGDTAQVLFESANFNGASVRRTAVALNMRTEASARYEKGLDPMNTMKAVQRACELVELLGAGEVVDGVMDVIAKDAYPTTVKLEPEKVNGLLGTNVSEAEMRRILLSLGFELDGDTILVPSWRSDVEHYSDIAEEVARFYGYNNIPNTLNAGMNERRGFSPVQKAENAIGALCRTAGYNEIITYSFISPTYYDKIDLPKDSPLRDSLKILNPLGEDTSIMRTTTLPSMLEILARNYNFRNKSVKLYELGRTYFAKNDGSGMANEPKVLSLGAFGPDMDFFALKGAVETVLEGLRISGVRYEAEKENPSYHPGRCAKVWCGDTLLGVLGQIHPHVAANYGVDCELYAAELRFDALYESIGPEPVYQPLPKFPAVTRDIAVVCDQAVTVGALEACIRKGAKGLLKDVALFDIYTGTGIPAGKKSVAFNLTLRADDRNLTAQEADEDVKSILDLLKTELDAVLR